MIGNDWDQVLDIVWKSEGYKKFISIIDHEYATKTIFPERHNVFNALKLTPYKNVKVVIVGQDPYHGINEAHGLSFSVQKGVPIPPSLRNIYQELETDLGIKPAEFGDLTKWAEEGVLLLNAVLTVEKDKAASHQGKGWELLTDFIIKELNKKSEPIVFILWGNFARTKKAFITNKKHLIIESTHPSPFSARNGFFGSKPFSKANNFLIQNNIKPIDWTL